MEVWAGEVEKARAQRTHWLVALLAEAADCNIFFSLTWLLPIVWRVMWSCWQ
jgi:hypothetical protein